MAVKTFTDNTSLPASDINTYLANSGLVYVTEQTVGTTVASVTVANCFSSTFDHYRILYFGGVASGNCDLSLQLSGITTGYYGGQFGAAYATGNYAGRGVNAAASWSYVGSGAVSIATLACDVFNPNVTKRKNISAIVQYNQPSNAYSMFSGEATSTSQATGFVMAASAGTITGGTITVYGYRKA